MKKYRRQAYGLRIYYTAAKRLLIKFYQILKRHLISCTAMLLIQVFSLTIFIK